MPSRRKENARRTRADILEVALDLFGTKGFQAVSVDDICAAVGLSRGGFYHHFANREECFEAVWIGLQLDWATYSQQLTESYQGDDVWELLHRSFCDLFIYWAEPKRRQINLIDPIRALGYERCQELQRGNGESQVTRMLRHLGRKHDPMLSRLVTAAITDATFHVGFLDGDDEVSRQAADALVELIRGLPPIDSGDSESEPPAGS